MLATLFPGEPGSMVALLVGEVAIWLVEQLIVASKILLPLLNEMAMTCLFLVLSLVQAIAPLEVLPR